MTVAWLGNRETQLERAAEEAAKLLEASKRPVILFDTDIHGTRAIVALADRVGAAYDIANGSSTLREAAQFTDRGAMTIVPGETRRRADLLVLIGATTPGQAAIIEELATTTPDLGGGKPRALFSVDVKPKGGKAWTALSSGKGGVLGTLAALRAQLAGRPVSAPVRNFDIFSAALADARFPVFIWSGLSGDSLALDMLQGLVADINSDKRASSLHLPADENGWGSVLASGWSSGFAPRTGFARRYPEYDPWRFDVERMIADSEADLLMTVGDCGKRSTSGLKHIALASMAKPQAGADISIGIGRPGVDHDAVVYRSKMGTIGSAPASAPTDRPSAAAVIHAIRQHLVGGAS